jgi:prepilin-type N-terminal cleavage/methylation domain-containing protein
MKSRGFTLIELLIVIAIILILIAIALPNFLEAQIRAKVANSASEMRSLEIAITSYSLDHRRHMGDGFEVGGGEGDLHVYSQLTTPHAYLTAIPIDEFLPADRAVDDVGAGTGVRDPRNNVYRFYAARWRCQASFNTVPNPVALAKESCTVTPAARGLISLVPPFDPVVAFAGSWIVVSAGPDQSHGYGEWIMHKDLLRGGNPRVYSPTNGTVSYGDIARWGS